MKKLTVITLALLAIATTYSAALLFTENVAGVQVYPESLAELGLPFGPSYIVLLAAFGTALAASLGDFADECFGDALLLGLLLADLGMLLVPQEVASVCSMIFEKLVKALAALVFKIVLEEIKARIRKRGHNAQATDGDAVVAQHLVDDGEEDVPL